MQGNRCSKPSCYVHDGELCADGEMDRERCPHWVDRKRCSTCLHFIPGATVLGKCMRVGARAILAATPYPVTRADGLCEHYAPPLFGPAAKSKGRTSQQLQDCRDAASQIGQVAFIVHMARMIHYLRGLDPIIDCDFEPRRNRIILPEGGHIDVIPSASAHRQLRGVDYGWIEIDHHAAIRDRRLAREVDALNWRDRRGFRFIGTCQSCGAERRWGVTRTLKPICTRCLVLAERLSRGAAEAEFQRAAEAERKGRKTMTSEIVAVSGGKDSTAMALRLQEVDPRSDRTYLITPTGDELPGMKAHWERLENMLDAPLVSPPGPTLERLIDGQMALPNWRMRWCTRMIKLHPVQRYFQSLDSTDVHQCVGLRADEESRGGLYGLDAPSRYPLREWGWGKKAVVGYIEDNKIEIPRRTDCARCFFQRLHEWHELSVYNPDIYQAAVDQEHRVSKYRRKPCTFRSPSRDTWPAGLAELRDAFATRGAPPRRKDSGDGPCRICRM